MVYLYTLYIVWAIKHKMLEGDYNARISRLLSGKF